HGLQFGGVEGAHEVEGQDADGAGVTEDHDSSAAVCGNDFVELVTGAVQQLAVAFAAGENVFEVATQQGGVLRGVFLSGVFESQTFHYADTSFAKGLGGIDCETRQRRQRLGRFDGAREIARVDRGDRIVFESFSGGGRLLASTR